MVAVPVSPSVEPRATAAPRPAAMLYGPGHVIVHGNPAFLAEFGAACLGLPAAEALLRLPARAFELMDLAYREGRSVAGWIRVDGEPRRLVVAVRRDIETAEVYGIAIHVVPAAPALAGRADPVVEGQAWRRRR